MLKGYIYFEICICIMYMSMYIMINFFVVFIVYRKSRSKGEREIERGG